MKFSDSSLGILSSLSSPFSATLDTIVSKVSSSLQFQSSSRTYLRSSFLAVLLLVRDEDLVSESILKWRSDAQQDGQNVVLN